MDKRPAKPETLELCSEVNILKDSKKIAELLKLDALDRSLFDAFIWRVFQAGKLAGVDEVGKSLRLSRGKQ